MTDGRIIFNYCISISRLLGDFTPKPPGGERTFARSPLSRFASAATGCAGLNFVRVAVGFFAGAVKLVRWFFVYAENIFGVGSRVKERRVLFL